MREIRDLCNTTILEQKEQIEKLKISDASKEECTIKQHGEIKELKAEIERLQNESIGNCELAISMRNDNNLKGDCSYCIDKAKAEAIKEFAERLKQKILVSPYDVNLFAPYTDNLIDNLVKEMVGEQE